MFSHAIHIVARFFVPFVLILTVISPVVVHGGSVTAHPFTDDLVFAQPINRWSYWFENIPGYEFQAPSRLVLTYTESATLQRNLGGSLTVLLNDKPVASRSVPMAAGQTSVWSVNLPVEYFRAGINELRVVSRHRSVEGICSDWDNSTNWIKLKTATFLQLTRNTKEPYPLGVYPFPYLDVIADEPVTSRWHLPSSPSAQDIEAMLTLASDWGNANPTRPLRFNVQTGGAQASKHAIFIGQSGGSQPTGDAGAVTSEMQYGFSHLFISGGNAVGLMRSINSLAYKELTSGLQTTSVMITKDPLPERVVPGSRYGVFTFKELGIRSIRITGAFHQFAVFTVSRPLLANLGEACYLNLKFMHAASLSPNRSVMSIAINGREIGSVRLTDANANEGILKLPIPPELLRDSVWNISISCFHDLPSMHCDKFYDAIAWTLVDEDSTISLGDGSYVGEPYLERFPYLRDHAGKIVQPVTFWLPGNPTSAQLTTAAIIAGRAGQVNQERITWRVVLGNMQGGNPKGCVIALADRSSMGHLAPLRSKMKVAPNDSGSFTIDTELNLLPEALQNFTLAQASRSPWHSGAVVYTIIADERAMLREFDDVLTDGHRMNDLRGDVCLLNSTGTLVSYGKSDAELGKKPRRSLITSFRGLKGGNMDGLQLILWILAIVGLLALIGMIRGHLGRRRMSGGGPTGGHSQQAVAESHEVLKEMLEPEPKHHMQAVATATGEVADPADLAPLYMHGLTLEEVMKDIEAEDASDTTTVVATALEAPVADATAPIPVPSIEAAGRVGAQDVSHASSHSPRKKTAHMPSAETREEWGPVLFSSSPLPVEAEVVLTPDESDEWLAPQELCEVVVSNGHSPLMRREQFPGTDGTPAQRVSHSATKQESFDSPASAPSSLDDTLVEKLRALFAQVGIDQHIDIAVKDQAQTASGGEQTLPTPSRSRKGAGKNDDAQTALSHISRQNVEIYKQAGAQSVSTQLSSEHTLSGADVDPVALPNVTSHILITRDEFIDKPEVILSQACHHSVIDGTASLPRKNRRVIAEQEYLFLHDVDVDAYQCQVAELRDQGLFGSQADLYIPLHNSTVSQWYC